MAKDPKSDGATNRSLSWVGPALAVLVGVAVAVCMVVVSYRRSAPLTELELLLFQVVSLGLGLVGSFLIGKWTAHRPPNVRSAFRRVLGLYQAMGRFKGTISERRLELGNRADENGLVHLGIVFDSLDIIETQISENLQTAGHAMDDWRDLAPDEVRRVEDALERNRAMGE